jgi:hypothetical protein
MSIHQFSEMPIRQFIDSSIHRLSAFRRRRTRSGLFGTLYIASLATGRVIQARFTGDLAASFALTPDGGTLWVAMGTTGGQTVVLPVNATTGVPGRAVAYLPGPPVAIGL